MESASVGIGLFLFIHGRWMGQAQMSMIFMMIERRYDMWQIVCLFGRSCVSLVVVPGGRFYSFVAHGFLACLL
jgi:hypothetical protein